MTSAIDRFSGEHYFLSNFYPGGPVTAEHWFQCCKARTRRDMLYVLAAPDPREAKRRGRAIPLRPDWDRIKDYAMLDVLATKFSDPELRTRLLATAPVHLEEGNRHHDTYWGVCHCGDCSGEMAYNKLGLLLEDLRDTLVGRGSS